MNKIQELIDNAKELPDYRWLNDLAVAAEAELQQMQARPPGVFPIVVEKPFIIRDEDATPAANEEKSLPARALSYFAELHDAVKRVVTQRADDLCWRDVYTELAGLVGVDPTPHLIADPEQFIANCRAFDNSLRTGGTYVPVYCAAPPSPAASAPDVRCLFCGDPAVGIYFLDKGCTCRPLFDVEGHRHPENQVQWLCSHHVGKCGAIGDMELIMDLRMKLTAGARMGVILPPVIERPFVIRDDDAEPAAPSPSRPLAAAWLIERGQASGHAPIIWWCGGDERAVLKNEMENWTTDAVKARRFATSKDAEAMAARLFPKGTYAVTEHIFSDTFEPAGGTLAVAIQQIETLKSIRGGFPDESCKDWYDSGFEECKDAALVIAEKAAALAASQTTQTADHDDKALSPTMAAAFEFYSKGHRKPLPASPPAEAAK